MAKTIKAKVKIQIPGGGATPAPPVGSALGPYGLHLMNFCKQFNEKTAARKGETVPVEVIVYEDRSFDLILKTSPTSELILKKINLKKGSATPNTVKVGKISWNDIEEIARIKLIDLNVTDIEQAKKIVAGSARSMGIEVV